MKPQNYIVDQDEVFEAVVEKYPDRWFSHRWPPVLGGIGIAIVCGGLQFWYFQKYFLWWMYPFSVMIYLAGVAIDFYTTQRVIIKEQEFKKRGLATVMEEQCPFLPKYPELRDFFRLKAVLPEVVMTLAQGAFGFATIGAFVIRALAGLNNLYQEKRIDVMLNLIDGKIPVRITENWKGGKNREQVRLVVRSG